MTREQLEQAVPEIVRRLRAALAPERIYLFGSCASGTPGKDSDVDILVVVSESRLGFYQRATEASRALDDVDVPIDVLVYTREEFDRQASLSVSLERTVLNKGKLVYAA
jgi:predicted nucleotidyltransferase